MKKIILLDEQTRSYCGASAWLQYAQNYTDSQSWIDADLFVTHTEYDPYSADKVIDARRHGVPTLQIADGIIEWRNTWEHPPLDEQRQGAPLWQPVLADKIACLGEAQARTLEAWGNSGKCEVTGAPRFEKLVRSFHQSAYRRAVNSQGIKILIATAKRPAFRQSDAIAVVQALQDVKAFLRTLNARRTDLIVQWRIAETFAREIALSPREITSGAGDLAEVLVGCDLVICTPSTLMLEAMLMRKPVVRLDYTNSPQYVRSAWNILSKEHIETEIIAALEPQMKRWVFQDEALRDALLTDGSSAERLNTLCESIIEEGRAARKNTKNLVLPPRILPRLGESGSPACSLGELHCSHGSYAINDLDYLRAENAHLRNMIIIERSSFEERIRQMQMLLNAPFKMRVFNTLVKTLRRLLFKTQN